MSGSLSVMALIMESFIPDGASRLFSTFAAEFLQTLEEYPKFVAGNVCVGFPVLRGLYFVAAGASKTSPPTYE